MRWSSLQVKAALAALVIAGAVSLTTAGGEEATPKRVLIISTGSRLAPGFITVDRQLLQALENIPSVRIEIYAENLDLVRFPNDRYQLIFREYLAAKYAEFPPDLVILVFVGNLGVPGNLLPQMFPRTPIIVAGLTEEEVRIDQFSQQVRGIVQRIDPNAALEMILRLQPDLRRVIVVAGTAAIDRQVLERVKAAATAYKGRIEIDFWDNLSMAQLRQAVAKMPERSAILFTRMFRDGAGQAVVSSQVAQAIGQWANVPVYVLSDAGLGTGAVGGALASVEAFGKRAGELARSILTETTPASLPFEIRTDSVPIFDWRALKRWGIPETRLPPNSIVRFKPPSLWDESRWYVIGALIIILVQGAMIGDLLFQRRRRRRIEAELRDNQQLMELAANAGEMGLWARELDQDQVWANSYLRAILGFGENEPLVVNDLLMRIHHDDRTRVVYDVEKAQLEDLPFEGEFRVVLPSGRERWIAARDKTVSGPRGPRRMGVVLDITERKQAEEALKQERAFLRQVIDVVPNFIFAKDRKGRFTLANKEVADAYGTTVENLIGKTDADFNRNLKEVDSFRRMDLQVIDTRQERFISEERMTDFQGRVRWLQTVKRPIIEPDGSARQVLGASTDITQRKHAEIELREQRAQLAHAARITTMGELAASLAHELNQPLTAILSNAQAALRFLSSKPADIEEVREILQDIVNDNSRAGEVIRRMRALVKKEELEFAVLDLVSLVQDVVVLVHSDAILQNVKISLQLKDNLPTVRGDKVQLQQVVLNLLLNAFDAMKDDPGLGQREVKLQIEGNGMSVVQVSVRDNGPGLSGDKLDKIFEPFYTTKGEGLGMGLSICRSIISAHGGHLWAENNADRGATFYFTLPAAGGGERGNRNDGMME